MAGQFIARILQETGAIHVKLWALLLVYQNRSTQLAGEIMKPKSNSWWVSWSPNAEIDTSWLTPFYFWHKVSYSMDITHSHFMISLSFLRLVAIRWMEGVYGLFCFWVAVRVYILTCGNVRKAFRRTTICSSSCKLAVGILLQRSLSAGGQASGH
jgi:hypothetical protein